MQDPEQGIHDVDGTDLTRNGFSFRDDTKSGDAEEGTRFELCPNVGCEISSAVFSEELKDLFGFSLADLSIESSGMVGFLEKRLTLSRKDLTQHIDLGQN